MGPRARGGAPTARAQHDPRAALLPELRADLVRLHATGGRAHKDSVFGPLPRANQGTRTALKLLVSIATIKASADGVTISSFVLSFHTGTLLERTAAALGRG